MMMATITLKHGDVIEQLRTLDDESVDAIITDPPYNLSFMGKKWDSKGGPLGFQQWCAEWGSECLRVLRRGGFIFSFGGTRTYHRMTSGLEDAGFVIKDCFSWNYGSGFPKSQNTAKAIDKKLGVEPTILGRNPNSREKSGKENTLFESGTVGKTSYITEPTSDLAKRWNGYGSASIKPAWEPIILAQKPFKGTIINNVIEQGVGVVNIDACRISHNEPIKTTNRKGRQDAGVFDDDSCGYDNTKNTMASASPSGRFPANVLLSHHPNCVEQFCKLDCPIHIMDNQSGDTTSTRVGNPKDAIKKVGNKLFGGVEQKVASVSHDYRDSGGASRFFYHAKVSKRERTCNGEVDNKHPTLKPIALMEYLIKFACPTAESMGRQPVIVDCFLGSGSTAVAANRLGIDCIGIEYREEALETAYNRLIYDNNLENGVQAPAFEGWIVSNKV